MKKIAIFCIPAHGHTNPILPVAAELTRRGHVVRFYSFEQFREKKAYPFHQNSRFSRNTDYMDHTDNLLFQDFLL